MNFKERIRDGLQGKYKGLSNGLNRINRYIFGIQRKCYYLVGGASGSGKTTLVDFMLVNALQDARRQGITVNVFYYSYEIDEISKKANWLSIIVYNKYGIVIEPEKIKGLGDYRLSHDERQLVDDCIPELEELFGSIMWRWENVCPTGMYREWWDFMKGRGYFETEPYTDENGEEKKRIVRFVNKNPDEYNMTVIDHMALCKFERGFTLKENLDKLSEFAIKTRNLFGMTHLWLQQFNQGLSSVERQKFKGVDISPQQSDFKDSSSPYQDCDVAIGLMNAHKMDMDTCLGYNINKKGAEYNLKDKFRMLKVIKNRLSKDDVKIGLMFKPESGGFEELPYPQDIDQAWIDDKKKEGLIK
jgi:replicative DNA helicase